MAISADPSNEKPAAAIERVETRDDVNNPKDAVAAAAQRGQAATGYEELTPWETIKLFKKSTAVCFAAAFSAATDGYQIA
jgi:hypothetical protein